MAIAVTGLLNTHNTSPPLGENTFTTGSFTPANNSLLYIFGGCQRNGAGGDIGAPTITDSLGGHLTYTARATRSWAVTGQQFVIQQVAWTAPVSTGASMTLTVNAPSVSINIWTVAVLQITGYDTSTPVGGTASSGADADIGDGAETQTLSAAPLTADITVVTIFHDAEQAPAVSYGTGSWTSVYDSADPSGSTSRAVAYRTASTSTSVPITDVYTPGSGTRFKTTMQSVVIQAAAAATFVAPPPLVISQAVPTAANW